MMAHKKNGESVLNPFGDFPVPSLLDKAVHSKHLRRPSGETVQDKGGWTYHDNHAMVDVGLCPLIGILVEHADGLDHTRRQG